jgi:UDP-N-acetylglucosamine:LPS N-acetylglucosamine transferase
VSTLKGYEDQLDPSESFSYVNDANRNSKAKMLLQAIRIAWIVFRLRPDVVISTGAAPGYFAMRFGKLIGARTIWIDSIANAEEMSMTGRIVGKYADLWLTQWPELARPGGPEYKGEVL